MGTMNSVPVTPVDIAADRAATFHMDCGYRLFNNDIMAKYKGLPTTCYGDVVLGNIPTWVLLVLLAFVLLPVVIIASRRAKRAQQANGLRVVKHSLQRYRYSRKARADAFEEEDEREKIGFEGVTSHKRRFTERAPWLWSTLSVIFQLLIVASLLMNILEIVRLILANRGPGLLPFQLAGILLVLLIYHVPYTPKVRVLVNGIILLFWTLCVALTAVRLAIYASLQDIEPRTNTEYHLSDEIIDVAVIVGLYGIFFVVELLRLPTTISAARRA